jgi:periplasmic protein TonB
MGLVLGQRWASVAIAVRPPVLPVQLVTLDTVVEEPKVTPPTPLPTPPPQRIRPPRALEPARPKEAPPVVKAEEPAPPPPIPVAPTPSIEPAPVASAPDPPTSEPAAPGPPVTSIAPSSPSNGASAPAAPVTTATRTSMAVPEGITQYARPQGGYQVRPSYPATPRRLGIQGTTMLRVHVLADGRIGDVLVEKSGGHPDLDQAATEAVRAWRFDPARRGTEPVAMWVLLPVEFRLR